MIGIRRSRSQSIRYFAFDTEWLFEMTILRLLCVDAAPESSCNSVDRGALTVKRWNHSCSVVSMFRSFKLTIIIQAGINSQILAI
jgi:hypothetical protein